MYKIKFIVFKIEKDGQINTCTTDKTDASCSPSMGQGEQVAEKIVNQYTDNDNGQIVGIKIAIKPKGHPGQKNHSQIVLMKSIQTIPSQQYKGKKKENKNIRIK